MQEKEALQTIDMEKQFAARELQMNQRMMQKELEQEKTFAIKEVQMAQTMAEQAAKAAFSTPEPAPVTPATSDIPV